MMEISLIHMSVPKSHALLWEAQDGWRNKGVDHGDSERIWENSHTFSLTSLKTFSSFNSPIHISPEIMYFDNSTLKKKSQESLSNLALLVGFCFVFCFHNIVNYIQKKNLNFYFGGKLSNFIMVELEVIWNSLFKCRATPDVLLKKIVLLIFHKSLLLFFLLNCALPKQTCMQISKIAPICIYQTSGFCQE